MRKEINVENFVGEICGHDCHVVVVHPHDIVNTILDMDCVQVFGDTLNSNTISLAVDWNKVVRVIKDEDETAEFTYTVECEDTTKIFVNILDIIMM